MHYFPVVWSWTSQLVVYLGFQHSDSGHEVDLVSRVLVSLVGSVHSHAEPSCVHPLWVPGHETEVAPRSGPREQVGGNLVTFPIILNVTAPPPAFLSLLELSVICAMLEAFQVPLCPSWCDPVLSLQVGGR